MDMILVQEDMRDTDKEKIRRNWVILLNDLDAKALTPYFISAFVLVPDEDEKIRTFSTPKDQNDVFLKMIMKKGENAYKTFLLALEKTGNQHIVLSLEDGCRDSGLGEDTCVAICPRCKKTIRCLSCSQPYYDEAYSSKSEQGVPYQQQVSLTTNPLPCTGEGTTTYTYQRNHSPDLPTTPKTLHEPDSYPEYQPLVFGSPKEGKADRDESFGLDFPDSIDSENKVHDNHGSGSNNKGQRKSSDRNSSHKRASTCTSKSRDISDRKSGEIKRVVTSDSEESSSSEYYNFREYENVPPPIEDNKKIKPRSPLMIQTDDVNPEVEEDAHFRYYKKHLSGDKGWCPAVYTVDEVKKLLQVYGTAEGQYLLWYEGITEFLPFVSVYSGAGVSHHFKIRMFPKTPDKKRAFFIDDSYQFERIEELIEHVKQYGIPLDNEVSTEAALY